MGRKKTNKLWIVPKEELYEIVKNSDSLSQILLAIGLSNKGTTNYQRLKKRLDEESIDFGHIKLGIKSNSGRVFGQSKKKIPLEELLNICLI